MKLWEVSSGEVLRSLEGHNKRVISVSVSFSPDGKLLASGGDDKTVKLWEVSSGKLLRSLEGHSGEVFSINFSSDNVWLASSSNNGTVRLWGTENQQAIFCDGCTK